MNALLCARHFIYVLSLILPVNGGDPHYAEEEIESQDQLVQTQS